MRDWINRHPLIAGVISSLIATAISSGAYHFLLSENSRPALDDHREILRKKEESPIVEAKDEAAARERKRLAAQAIEQEKWRRADEAARLEKDEAARAALAQRQTEEQRRHEEASRQSTLEKEARHRATLAEQQQAEERKKREAEAVQEEARHRAAIAGQTAYVSRLLRVEAVEVRRLANEIKITLLLTNLSNQPIWWTAGYTSRAITDRGYQYGFQTSFKDATNLLPGVPVRISYTFTGSDPTAQRVTVILTQSSVYKPEPDIIVRNIPLL